MRRIIAGGVVVAFGAGLAILGLSPWLVVVGVSALAAAAWRLTICRHPGPLGLLPPTTAFDGSTLPSRWYCDACGATWPAHFEKGQTPIRRFTGYDPSKALNAAKRAAELEDRQRALALQRAGLRPAGAPRLAGARSTSARKTKPASEPATPADLTKGVVSIEHGRRFAG